jgi:hypothetical protein
MLSVRVTENVRAVQSSYYSSCPWSTLQLLCPFSENSTPLKGFQLWLAENKDLLPASEKMNALGLQKWKELSKEEKESYKSPRVPKRKREEPEGESAAKSLKLT